MSASTDSGSPAATGKPALVAFASDDADIATLKAFALGQQWPDATIFKGDIKTATDYLKTHPSPVLLVVELPSATEAPALLDGLADVCDPDTKVLTIGTINEYSFYCWLMELGIFSYLLRPLTQAVLDNAYAKSLMPAPQPEASTEKKPGKLIAVLGTRGGVGATTISINLASIIADAAQKRTALVDIDPQEGSIALALDIEPSRGLRDALEKPDRIDGLFIERVMARPFKNLSVLSAEESLQDYLSVHEQAAELLLKELRATFDIVVLDIPRHLNGFSRACLKQAEHVVLVTELTLLSLRDCLRLSDLMRDSLKMKPPMIVASRIGAAGKQEMQAADFEKGINAKLAARIPFAPELFMQLGSDVAALKSKTHQAIKPLYALTEQMVPEVKAKAEVKEKKSLGGLFKKKE